MNGLFDIKCRGCGAPVGYDIEAQTYRCPYCGETAGIEEVRKAEGFRKIDFRDRAARYSAREVLSCPDCGAELLYEPGDATRTCTFCGGTLVRREFEVSEDFPQYILPFVLTREDAQERLRSWLESSASPRETAAFRDHLEELEGYYLPYDLVRGPVHGYVLREQVDREFEMRSFIETALVSTSRQLDNELLDAAEPFDLNGLKVFEHGYIAGHKVKLADLSGAKRTRRTLQEAGEALKPQMEQVFHTDGVRVRLLPSQLQEIPVLLPLYLLKSGRRLAVVNGQTGRVAVRTVRAKQRSRTWLLEPLLLSVLAVLSLWLVTGSFIAGLLSAIPMALAIWFQYRDGRFSLFGTVIEQGKETRASRENRELKMEEEPVIRRNPFPLKPVFQEEGQDIRYRFYPPDRVIRVAGAALFWYFLPVLAAAVLHFGLGLGGFRLTGAAVWFMVFGIFTVVYVFSGIRCGAYEHPYIYAKDGSLTGAPSSRKLPFFASLGLDRESIRRLGEIGKTRQQLILIEIGLVFLLLLSIYGILC